MSLNPQKHNAQEVIYGEMIYALLNEMNGAVMAQVRSINNSEAMILKAVTDLQKSIALLDTDLKATRDKRYQEEIDVLELQMENLKKLLDEKRITAQNTQTTSEKMRSMAEQAATKIIETEKRKNEIDWNAIKKNTIQLVIGAFAVVLFWYLLPLFGQFLQNLVRP